MSGSNSTPRKAQLDKEEREHLEDVVTDLRDLVEREVEYELEQQYDLSEREGGSELSDEKQAVREELVEAIEHENPGEKSWEWCYEQYVNGVGYTFINRIAALRCMEVRGFIEQPVTQIGDSGLTPAAEQILAERFDVGRNEALLVAFEEKCERFDDEIELLFDTNSPYTVLDVDSGTFEDAVQELDKVSEVVWRADDVLGWVYEYYNVGLLDDLRQKADQEGLEPEDVPAANQFYTPHWVVRMLTDNSLGKLYLEHTGELEEVVEQQESFSLDERKHRPLSPNESPDIADFCTYLVPSEEDGEPTDFDHPSELRVIDPACGSGHFLLYAFDVLERVWRAETDIDDADIPRKVLKYNLYGVDLDMRACQLAAFNLYLKGRTRAEAEGADGFDIPEVGIVCADAKVADVEGVEAVFEEVAGEDEDVAAALQTILDAFEEVHGLGSLLDVRGTLGDLFEDDADVGGMQLTLGDDPRESHTLGQVLHSLREAVEEHRESESFLAQDLRSFVRLLDILAQDYDVALMNPPYGSQGKMPDIVESYVQKEYKFGPEFYINFYEVCDNLVENGGRVGMLIPRSFMFKRSFTDFREDFLHDRGAFDYLAEFGLGILDNATVRTVGTVLRPQSEPNQLGSFIRLHDLDADEKEEEFVRSVLTSSSDSKITRQYKIEQDEFKSIPGSPISYWTPQEVRELHQSTVKLDAKAAGTTGESACTIATGLQTGDNDRFIQKHWEVTGIDYYKPLAKGSSDAWILPSVTSSINWSDDGAEIARVDSSVVRNRQHYGKESLTWNHIKATGRRFGYYPPGGIFDQTGSVVLPGDDLNPWQLLGVVNSDLYHSLFLSLTPERHWNPGDVGKIPWIDSLSEPTEICELVRSQYEIMVKRNSNNPTSPYYISPNIHPTQQQPDFFYNHPHSETSELQLSPDSRERSKSESLSEIAKKVQQERVADRHQLEQKAAKIDSAVFDTIDVSDETREQIRQEIFLRTSESPEDREVTNPGSVSEVPENIDQQVKDLVHHFAMEAVRKEDDGIIPITSVEEQPDMLERIVKRFEDVYGEYAEDRLVEVDDILGAQSAAEEAYPNLRAFIDEGLFKYHVQRMENTPILWKLTTDRLVADVTEPGFACFADYHQLDAGLFDRLTTQYLDPRKDDLRARQSTANQRRNNDALPPTERSEAATTFERTTNMLDQIAELEGRMEALGSVNEREDSLGGSEVLGELSKKIAVFYKETSQRLKTLSKLREQNTNEWFEETFTGTFWEKVQDERDEWLNALDDLEHACQMYAKPTDEPVEAHLADLFNYFSSDLKGSDHFASSGILFMTYYFESVGEELLNEDGEPYNHLSEDEELLASLATGLDDSSILDESYIDEVWEPDDDNIDDGPPALVEYKALAEEIDDRCQIINKEITADWADRALSEITTAGYRPNHKHGVAINITPLAEQNIVPEIVDDKVL